MKIRYELFFKMPSSYSLATRVAVVTLRQQHASWAAIVKQVDAVRSRSSARRIWSSRHQWDRPGHGRHTVITKAIAKRIDRAISKDPWASPQELVQRLHLQLSASTVQRYRSENFKSVKGVGRPILSETNKKARLKWCQMHRNDSFDNVVFTDEKSFLLYHNRRLAWIKPGEELPFHSQPSHVPRVQILGGITRRGRTAAVLFEGWLNADQHKVNLDTILPSVHNLLPGGFRYLQDNDPSHTAKSNLTHLERCVPEALRLPAQSPDLNPIEHLWSALDARIARHHVTTKQQLERVVRLEWRSISTDECNRLIDGLRSTMEAVIAAHGGHVRPEERRRYAGR